jgi:hypothetical protein
VRKRGDSSESALSRFVSELLVALGHTPTELPQERNMPHPIYGPPAHQLEHLEVKVGLPTPANDHKTSIQVHGVSGGKRAPLFALSEAWAPDEITRGLQASDWLAHVVLALLQDRPSTLQDAQNSLRGEASEQGSLPL